MKLHKFSIFFQLLFLLGFLLFFNLLLYNSYSAETINLSDCIKYAENSYPLTKQIVLNKKITDLNIKNLDSKYYPELNLNGQAQYQSDVTKIGINLPPALGSIPTISKESYKIGLNVNQLIWDGGLTANQITLEQSQLEVNNQNVEVQLYGLRQKVSDLYFGIIMLEKQIELINVLKSDLQAKMDLMNIRIQNGILLQSSADIIQAEIIKSNQNIDELKSTRISTIKSLSELTGKPLSDDINLELPQSDFKTYDDSSWQRPEYESFSKTKSMLNKMEQLNDSKYMPKFFAFGQAAYGKPGLNMFDPDFASYYLVGVKASWDIWNWDTPSREKEILQIQKEITNTQEESFTKNLKIANFKFFDDVNNIKQLIEQDKELIDLRKKISVESSSQLDNGVITATDYISQLNSETQAKINLEIRKIQLNQTIVNYYNQIGIPLK